MGYIKMLGGFVMMIIFGLAIVSFVITYGSDNNSFVGLDDDFKTYRTEVNQSIQDYYVNSSDGSSTIFQSVVTEGSQTTQSGQGIKGGIHTLYKSSFKTLDLVSKKIFGGDDKNNNFNVVFTLISSFIVFVMAVYFIKTWIGANPD